jgi:hypothetical protein
MNASDVRRFDEHEKIEILTVTIRWTLGSRKGRNTDGRLIRRAPTALFRGTDEEWGWFIVPWAAQLLLGIDGPPTPLARADEVIA